MHTSASASPLTVKFSPNWPYSKSSRPSCCCQYRYDSIWYTNTARCSPPCPVRSPCPSPSIFSRRTSLGPSTGRFHTAVWTTLPRQATSFGRPTFTESKRPAGRTMITSMSGQRQDDGVQGQADAGSDHCAVDPDVLQVVSEQQLQLGRGLCGVPSPDRAGDEAGELIVELVRERPGACLRRALDVVRQVRV